MSTLPSGNAQTGINPAIRKSNLIIKKGQTPTLSLESTKKINHDQVT
jgi:hypothetical protein